jgi:hypothetical protein
MRSVKYILHNDDKEGHDDDTDEREKLLLKLLCEQQYLFHFQIGVHVLSKYVLDVLGEAEKKALYLHHVRDPVRV